MGFRGVLLDWRGTLVVAPTFRWLVVVALERLGRDTDPEEILTRLRAVDPGREDVDSDAALHRTTFLSWLDRAGVDAELAEAIYAVESDGRASPFADDVGRTLWTLHQAGVRVGVLSDIHFDLRPAFAGHRHPDGSSWADRIDAWALSFQLGLTKPDPAIFAAAVDRLGLPAADVLMVGDRSGWDGAAVESGITTLLLPPLRAPHETRLPRVLDLALPVRARR